MMEDQDDSKQEIMPITEKVPLRNSAGLSAQQENQDIDN